MPSLFEYDLGDWKDPFPAPVVEEHDGFMIVRDDLLDGGSKMRFADYLIQSQPEIEESSDLYGGSCEG